MVTEQTFVKAEPGARMSQKRLESYLIDERSQKSLNSFINFLLRTDKRGFMNYISRRG